MDNFPDCNRFIEHGERERERGADHRRAAFIIESALTFVSLCFLLFIVVVWLAARKIYATHFNNNENKS